MAHIVFQLDSIILRLWYKYIIYIKCYFIYNKRICIHLLWWSYSTIIIIIHLLCFWISKLRLENLSTLTKEENSGFEPTQVNFRWCAFHHHTTQPLCKENEWLKEESSFTPLLNLLFQGQRLCWVRRWGLEEGRKVMLSGFTFTLLTALEICCMCYKKRCGPNHYQKRGSPVGRNVT